MDGFLSKALGMTILPVVLLGVLGMFGNWCSGQHTCPWDPVTKEEYCTPYEDHAAWSRATAWEEKRLAARK